MIKQNPSISLDELLTTIDNELINDKPVSQEILIDNSNLPKQINHNKPVMKMIVKKKKIPNGFMTTTEISESIGPSYKSYNNSVKTLKKFKSPRTMKNNPSLYEFPFSFQNEPFSLENNDLFLTPSRVIDSKKIKKKKNKKTKKSKKKSKKKKNQKKQNKREYSKNKKLKKEKKKSKKKIKL